MIRSQFVRSVSLGLISIVLIISPGCRTSGEDFLIDFHLVELQDNPETGYYKAVVRIEKLDLGNAWLDRFDVVTPTSYLPLADLVFLESGTEPDVLEIGDTFIVPLNKPDWRLSLAEGPESYGRLVFWNSLPESAQWHPLKSEAMGIARSLQLAEEEGYLKPLPSFFPRDWIKWGEKLPDMDDPVGEIVYQKIRGEIVREEFSVLYTRLTEEEHAEMNTLGPVNFLRAVTAWGAENGREDELEGRPVLFWDNEGEGIYGWSYRYIYIDGNVLIEVRLDADPLEWIKTDQEKAQETRTDKVFLRYGFWPVGPEEWNVLIEIRMDRTGRLLKRSETKDPVEKSFDLEDWEFQQIETVLEDNRFIELESRSGPPGGITSFISVLRGGTSHSVEVRNFPLAAYRAIEGKIRDIVLPKVGERFKF